MIHVRRERVIKPTLCPLCRQALEKGDACLVRRDTGQLAACFDAGCPWHSVKDGRRCRGLAGEGTIYVYA
jgi:RNase P subunit RPR2